MSTLFRTWARASFGGFLWLSLVVNIHVFLCVYNVGDMRKGFAP